MKKFLALIVILTMVLALIPFSMPAMAMMSDETPSMENQAWLWNTIRLEYGCYTREMGPPRTRSQLVFDGGGGSAIREIFLRFEFGEELLAQYRNNEVDIQEVRIKMNIMGTGAQPAGVYLMPPHLAHFDYRTLDGPGVSVVVPTPGGGINSSMRTDARYVVSRFSPSARGPLLTGDLWERTSPQANFSIREFLERYPDETGVTVRLSLFYTVFTSPGVANPWGGPRGGMTITGMSRLPGEPIMRVGLITDAMSRVNDAIDEVNYGYISSEDHRNISKNLNLPTSRPNGVSISWQSSDNSIIDAAGFVNRPAFGESDRDVTLTATFSHHDPFTGPNHIHSLQREFNLTVLANRANPAHATATTPVEVGGGEILTGTSTVTANLSAALANVSNLDSVWLRLVPLNGEFTPGDSVTVNGVTRLLDESGSVYVGDLLPGILANGASTQTFTIVSTAEFHGAAATVTSDLRPAIIAVSFSDALASTINHISPETIYVGNVERIREDLDMFTSWRYTDPVIAWTSSQPNVIDAAGALTRPQNDTPVTLTATVTAGGASQTKTINVIALGISSDAGYFEWLLNNLTFDRMVATSNFTLPTIAEQTNISWVAADPTITRIGTAGDGYVNVIINRQHGRDVNARITAFIDDGVEVSQAFYFTIIRTPGSDRFVTATVVDENAGRTKRLAVNDDVNTRWSIIENDRTITLDTIGDTVFSEFAIVYEGVNVSGVRIYSSTDGSVWSHAHTGGAMVPDRHNLITLSAAVRARFVRFVFPAGVTGVNFIGGYSMGGGDNGTPGQTNIFETLVLPARITGPIELPTEHEGYAITSWTSASPSVARIDGFTLTPTRQITDRTINLTATAIVNGETQTGVIPIVVVALPPQQGNGNGGGGGGGGAGGGGNWNRPGGGMDVGNISNVTPQPPDNQPVELPFNDITGHWASNQIVWLYSRNVVSGDGTGGFAPNNSMTREQMAQIIVNAFELERINGDAPFADANPGDWFFNAVSTMYDHGISLGDGTGNYGVGLNISRQDAVVLLYRMLVNMDAIAGATASAAFVDYAAIADYAIEAVNTFRALEIVSGDPAGNFNPTDSITRAEMAIIIYRTLEFLR
ncbi:MAG: S-layer homology domain-containing protein [Oscillospiraceae bacterium]|nr:S-layer homology domain-containing protein [Oscillospiraceae bacterium]